VQKNDHQILSTAALDKELVDYAGSHGCRIDAIPFIETNSIVDENLKNRIKSLSQQNIIAVFTSNNSVDAVVRFLNNKPAWKIYCVGHTTKSSIQDSFGKSSIAGVTDNANQLAELIIQDNIERVIFFCGDKRRDELPDKLKEHNIFVEEIVVYTTNETPLSLKKKYDAILFLSPSAVHSFFSENKVDVSTQLFAIGSTTASAIRDHTNVGVVMPESPSKENLVKQVIAHLNTIKNDQTVV
jgi:uroporphyrinogen-III synthase